MGNQLAKMETVSTELLEVILPSGNLIHLEGRDGFFQCVDRELTVPSELTYKIKSGEKGEVGFIASFYDLTSIKMGLQFGDPQTIYEDDNRVRVLVPVEYWSREGKKVRDAEEYEVNCQLLYEKTRFGWQDKKWDAVQKKYVVKREAKIKVIRDDKHPENPPKVWVELPDDAESEIYENFLTLKRNKLAKAITCAHRRLAQRALGIKKVEANTNSDGWNKSIKVRLYSMLPAEADRKEGIKAIADITGESTPPEKGEVKTEDTGKSDPKPEKKAEKLAEKPAEQPEEKPAPEKKEEKTEKQEEQTGDANNTCACGAVVEGRVLKYSLEKLGKVVCYNCQHPEKGKK